MNSYYKNATIGLLVILGAVVFVVGSLWLRGKTIRRPDVQVVFDDIGNLKEGAPVRVSGAPVGRVSEIQFMGVGHVRVGLMVDATVHPTRAAKVSITGVGMLGDAVITMDPGQDTPLRQAIRSAGPSRQDCSTKAPISLTRPPRRSRRCRGCSTPALITDMRHRCGPRTA